MKKIRITVKDSSVGPFSFESNFYQTTSRAPAIFITPIFGGVQIFESIIARFLSLSGFHVFITDFMPKVDLKTQVSDVNVHDRTYLKSVIGLKALLKELGTYPEVDTSRVGLFGMSLGGIFTALNTKAQKCVRASVIIAGSGNHARVLAKSSQPFISLLKKLRIKRFHLINDAQYETFMNQFNEFDSFKIQKDVDPDSVMMFVSRNDSQIPTSAQLDTVNDLRSAHVIYLKTSHFKTVVSVPILYFKQIRNFYRDRLLN